MNEAVMNSNVKYLERLNTYSEGIISTIKARVRNGKSPVYIVYSDEFGKERPYGLNCFLALSESLIKNKLLFPFGKYQGRYVADVYNSGFQYCLWFIKNVTKNTERSAEILSYLRKRTLGYYFCSPEDAAVKIKAYMQQLDIEGSLRIYAHSKNVSLNEVKKRILDTCLSIGPMGWTDGFEKKGEVLECVNTTI